MKDAPSQATDTFNKNSDFDPSNQTEHQGASHQAISPAGRKFMKHMVFTVLFFTVSMTMALLFVFYEPIMQNAFLPATLITLGCFTLGVLNFRRARRYQDEFKSQMT